MGRGSNRRGGPGAALRAAGRRLGDTRATRASAAAYRDGVTAWLDGRYESARDGFQAAVEADATNADALLGLQYLDPTDVTACENVYVLRSRLGAYQTARARRVHGQCTPVYFSAVTVVEPADTALALACALTGAGRRDEAERLLERHEHELSGELVAGLRARIAYSAGDYARVVQITGPLVAETLPGLDPKIPLGADPEMLHGAALLLSDRFEPAREWLTRALGSAALSEPARLWGSYALGIAHAQSGEPETAARLLEQVRVADPSYLDVNERLAALAADAPTPAAGDSFDGLRRSFESDAVADDPTLPDNR